MQIETEEQKWVQSNLLLTMCNGPREGGGFMIAPEAKMTMEFCTREIKSVSY
jgi:hypothetical protein